MKSKLLFTFLLMICGSICFSQATSPVVGTWKLISAKMTVGDSTYPSDNKTSAAIKIVTPTHFAVISQNPSDTTFQHAGAGTVKMDSKNYTEVILYGNVKSMIGKSAVFTYRIEGDKWYIKGGTDDMKFDEEWQRVK